MVTLEEVKAILGGALLFTACLGVFFVVCESLRWVTRPTPVPPLSQAPQGANVVYIAAQQVTIDDFTGDFPSERSL